MSISYPGIQPIYNNQPFCLANSYTDKVELFNFDLNKWESKNEWNYPFRNGRR